jgi:Flp pilus assembly protein TadG
MSEIVFRLRDDEGALIVETAFGFMILMAMIMGIMECSMRAYTYSVLAEAAREGVRYASVHGTDSTSCMGPSTGCDAKAGNVVTDVKTFASTYVSTTGMSVSVSYPDSASTGTSRVQVSVTQLYSPIFPYPGAPQTITVTSAGRILY